MLVICIKLKQASKTLKVLMLELGALLKDGCSSVVKMWQVETSYEKKGKKRNSKTLRSSRILYSVIVINVLQLADDRLILSQLKLGYTVVCIVGVHAGKMLGQCSLVSNWYPPLHIQPVQTWISPLIAKVHGVWQGGPV